ncbi:HNH endonuclease [Serratia marcescens]|nr:HNH endonuclease [Serratia marcescens]
MCPELDHLYSVLNYDKDTGQFTWKANKGKMKSGQPAGSVMRTGYVRIFVDRKPYLAHRLAWAFFNGEHPDGYIDHVNGNRCDNRITNLRIATHQENIWNSECSKSNKTGLKGVHFNARDKKFIAQITVNGKRKCLGSFENKHEAYEAYINEARLSHGRFSITNRGAQE